MFCPIRTHAHSWEMENRDSLPASVPSGALESATQGTPSGVKENADTTATTDGEGRPNRPYRSERQIAMCGIFPLRSSGLRYIALVNHDGAVGRALRTALISERKYEEPIREVGSGFQISHLTRSQKISLARRWRDLVNIFVRLTSVRR